MFAGESGSSKYGKHSELLAREANIISREKPPITCEKYCAQKPAKNICRRVSSQHAHFLREKSRRTAAVNVARQRERRCSQVLGPGKSYIYLVRSRLFFSPEKR